MDLLKLLIPNEGKAKHGAAGGNVIPLPLFFSKPKQDQVRISPGGMWLGWRGRDANTGVMNLWVKHTVKDATKQVTFETERDVCVLYWFSTDDQTLVYLREPQNGSELYHLYALDLDEEDPAAEDSAEKKLARDLIHDANTTCALGFVGNIQVWFDPNQPRYIYASTAPCGIRSLFWNICRIHLDTCQKEIVQHNPLSTWVGLIWFAFCSLMSFLLHCVGFGLNYHPRAAVQWFPDRQMNFRGRLEASLQDLSCAWVVQEQNSLKWKLLHSVEWEDANMSLVGSAGGSGTAYFDFTEDGRMVDLHLCNMGDTTSYERFEIATGKHVKQLARHQKSDITGFVNHPKTKKVQAVIYNYEKPTIESLRDCPQDIKSDLEYLQQQFEGAWFSITSRTLENDIWVIYAQSDTGIPLCKGSPNGFFLFHRISARAPGGSLKFEVSPQADFANYALASMEPKHILARDGEDLLCYLSTPSPQLSPQKTTPLVLLIHGGPQARDTWQFDPLCQLLCNRGMSVLQVNYRGSTGLGSRFMKLGMNGTFATKLQEDIQDAAQHAIKHKWCSANRIAIMGASFGGYCSLAAMTFMADTKTSPDFQCAIAICPPSIFGAANPHKEFYGNPLIAQYWRKVLGPAIANDVEASRTVSPLYHMEKTTKPIFIFHGEDDPRVPIQHSDEATQKLKVPGCQYVRFGKEGHGIRKEQNVLYMFHCIERFFCQHFQLPDPPHLEESWTKGHTGTAVHLEQENTNMKDKNA